MNREVTRPVLLRPPVRFLDSTSDFSGRSLVMSSRDTTVWKRRVAVTGLYVLIGITQSLSPAPGPRLDLREIGRLLALLQLHVGLLPRRAVAREPSPATQLPVERGRPHFRDLHFEQLLDGGLDLRLVGIQRHFEAQRALVIFPLHALLGHQRAADHVVEFHFASASEIFRAAASDSSTL